MPTILRSGPYRFYFYSHESNEPPHVHVDRSGSTAKLWLGTVQLARNIGFSANELRKVEMITAEHQKELLERWHGYFSTGSG